MIELKRWRRFGNDRLYVRDGTGVEVGWVDLKTGEQCVADADLWNTDVDLAVADWMSKYAPRTVPMPASAGTAPASSIASTALAGPPESAMVDPDWRDFATTRPGAAAMSAARQRTTIWTRLGRALGLRTQDRSWRVGAAGERAVARTLALFRPLGWKALHAVPVGTRGADIDHVVIGPGGVFSINAKHHRGAHVKAGRQVVFVAGQKTRYAQNSLHEAARASQRLSQALGRPIDVEPLIVIVGARSLKGNRADGVQVLTRTTLAWTLLFAKRRNTRREVDELFEIARRSTTWRSNPA